ncbi:MAG: HAMP domain-containing histidine kinase, partial [Oscillospiraceae bacterium]|nr:HAMP domain-containing histidine kinase [Oscillospiraceae bacterium]
LNGRSNEVIDVLAQNGGMFPKPDKKPFKFGDYMSPETPYETRFFTVYLNKKDEIRAVNTGFIAAISTESAIEYTQKIVDSKKVQGFINDYKFKVVSDDFGKMVVFLDCSRDLNTFRAFLKSSVLVSLAGLISVFVLVFIFSKIAVMPIVESYSKQKQFITDASHELKTPLTIIGANAEVIEMENGNSKWTESIKNQVKRLSELTNNLVSLAKMDEENQTLEMEQFSISDAVYEMVDLFLPLSSKFGKEITTYIEENITAKGNEKSIRQMLSILLDNAVKYSNDGGKIFVSLKKQGKRCEIMVQNSVTEIKAGYHNECFDRFYRADNSRNSKAGGYGIGLSLAKSIVEAHRGKIWAKSLDEKSFAVFVVI